MSRQLRSGRIHTREVVPIAMPAGTLETPDGMFLEGDRLFVAQNTPKSVGILHLSQRFTRAEPQGVVRNPSFAFPTSVARYRVQLLVVSAQFDTRGSPAAVSGNQPPVVPFWVRGNTEVARPGPSEPLARTESLWPPVPKAPGGQTSIQAAR